MCGIWSYIVKDKVLIDQIRKGAFYSAYQRLKDRGPDRSDFIEFDQMFQFFLGFHRLAIMDPSVQGDQPFVLTTDVIDSSCHVEKHVIFVLCNGEIYDYEKIQREFDLKMTSKCDCEVIPLLYARGLQEFLDQDQAVGRLVEHIKGSEFACQIIDLNETKKKLTIYAIRDPAGVRPMSWGEDDAGFAFSSELDGLIGVIEPSRIREFPPGHFLKIELDIDGTSRMKMTKYYHTFDLPPKIEPFDVFDPQYLEEIYAKIRTTLKSIVRRMLKSDRPLGALLSGGLDSSIVVALASQIYREEYGKTLQTFSIGMPGGTDEKFAKLVAKHCQTHHTHIEKQSQDCLAVLPKIPSTIETFDLTTVRASTPQFLAGQEVKKTTDIIVLLIGDGSDEICSGYMYFHKAPTPEESHLENCRLGSEISLYDVRRADRGISSHGLEARCPFLHHEFIDLILSLDCRLRVPIDGVEKWLLRKAFEGTGLLPKEVIWRPKEAFSDAISRRERSWFEIIQERASSMFTDEELVEAQTKYVHLPPKTKEGLLYRKLFEERFGPVAHVIPHIWLPRWCGDIQEPSARVLSCYRVEKDKKKTELVTEEI